MADQRYVALLRGINVGGKNPVPMAELRELFGELGHDDVRTHIQSGNVLFSTGTARDSLEDDIEAALEERYGTRLVVVVRSLRQLRSVVRSAPDGFGDRPDEFHSDAVFLKSPLTAAKAMKVVQTREGVDEAWPGTGVIYFQRLSAARTKSRMSKIVGTPEYALMTIRSWSTTTKLLELLEADA
ncbi:DUF1697 domain-containing protein [Dermatobacter hominis]|uniref:DUF1697 domain-containing protein n=1 Tax=Dermatobacter hominis TaxID=2884263 RepID=UPI001D12AD27|nr:DUF1697 domain-containing protein [Dermatobacter hominis]UDY34783.1 DUF1697 domain-containing protein [Dermatobacter hominis]